jgi:integrase
VARGIHRLTQLQLRRAKKRRWLCDGGGLYLQQGRSWIFRYKIAGRGRMLGLGPLALVDLAQARELALAARWQLHAGVDPLAARASARAAAAKSISFDDAVARYLEAHQAAWRNPKHRQQWGNTLATYASPVIGKLSVDAIDTGLVMRVLEPIWTTKPETASRLRGRIESVLAWATVRGYRTGDNPARWKNHLDHLLPSRSKVRQVQHHAALPYAELPAFMVKLREQDGIAARALEFLILTAVRTGDVSGQRRDDAPPMRWDHVDLAAKTWTIPRTKSGAEHRVPLSPAALAVLKQMRPLVDASGIVFPGLRRGQALSNDAFLRLLDRMGVPVTAHGFRATFKTWAGERTGFAREIVEACLTHTISDELERAYRRGSFFDKRARLMAEWAAFCASPGAGAAVIPLRS